MFKKIITNADDSLKKQFEVTFKLFGFTIYTKTLDKAVAYDCQRLGINVQL